MISNSSKYLLFLFIFFAVYSCKENRSSSKEIGKFIGNSVLFPKDTVFSENTVKIVILVSNPGDCSICNLQVYKWYIYKLEIEKLKLDCDIIYVLNNITLDKETNLILTKFKLNYYNDYNAFMKKNQIFKNHQYDTYLVSPNNKILLLGNPIENFKLWSLYKKKLSEVRLQ